MNALIKASYIGHLNVVKRLLDCEEITTNLQYKGEYTALMMALTGGNKDVANLLRQFEKKKIIEGFKMLDRYYPTDLMNLIIKFLI